MTPQREFAYRLALAVGELNPDNLPARAYFDWQKYLPYGTVLERLVDVHLATLCAIVANQWRKRGAKEYTPRDFFMLPRRPVRQASPKTLLDKVVAATWALGGTIIDQREQDGS